jgi:hypothetical protein
MLINNQWQVTRYNLLNVNSEGVANVANNTTQTSQPLTLEACVALTYYVQ